MYKHCLGISLLVSFVALTPAALQAQGFGTGNISGRVSNANDSPLAGAIVSATNLSDQKSISAVTNALGRYNLAFVAAARYKLSVQAKGHPEKVLPYIKLEPGESVVEDFRLDGSGNFAPAPAAVSAPTHPAPAPAALPKIVPVPATPRNDPPKIQLQDLIGTLNQEFQGKQEPELSATIQRRFAASKSLPGSYQAAAGFYYKNNEYEKALKIYELGAKAEKNNAPLFQQRIAEIQIELGNFAEATELVQALLKARPNDPEILAAGSTLKLYSGKVEERAKAIRLLQAELLQTPGNASHHFYLARALILQGNAAAATKHFKEAINLRSGYLPAYIALGQLHLQLGQWSDALSAGSKILALKSNNLMARLIRCSALLGSGQAKQARQELDGVFKLDPNSIEARILSGNIDLKEMKLDDAEKSFRQAQAANPSDIRPVVGLSAVVLSRGDVSGAIAYLNQEILAHPQQINLLGALGDLAKAAKKDTEAIAAYNQLVAKDPENLAAHFSLSRLYKITNNVNGALVHLRRVVELSPEDVNPAMELALLYEMQGTPAESEPIYEKVLLLQPDNFMVLNNLAFILVDKGKDLDRALELASQALRLQPAHPDIVDTFAFAHIKKELPAQAKDILTELIRRYPGYVNLGLFQYHLGMAYAALGDKAAARKALENGLLSKPSDNERTAIQALLKKL